MWKLNNTLLNNQWVKGEIKREIKKYLETNKKENTTEILDLKYTMIKLKILIESLNRLNQAEERISEFKDKSSDIIQSEEQKEKRIKRNKERLRVL